MNRFAKLVRQLSATSRASDKVAVLRDYFVDVPHRDAAWAVYFLCGGKLRRSVNSHQLQAWAATEAGLPDWLMDECRATVGDASETVSLVLPRSRDDATESGSNENTMPLHALIEKQCQPLVRLPLDSRRERILNIWRRLGSEEIYVLNKLLTCRFRPSATKLLLARALSEESGVSQYLLLHRLMPSPQPTEVSFRRLLSPASPADIEIEPYPFHPCAPFPEDLKSLGSVEDWQVEWQWNGVRTQLVRRGNRVLLWSQSGEWLTETFPQVAQSALGIPRGTVMDGKILAWLGNRCVPLNELRKPSTRRRASLKTVDPPNVVFMAHDLLEHRGKDIRSEPLTRRRDSLEEVMLAWEPRRVEISGADLPASSPSQMELGIGDPSTNFAEPAHLRLSPLIHCRSWEEVTAMRRQAMEFGAEGLILRNLSSPYCSESQPGGWLKMID